MQLLAALLRISAACLVVAPVRAFPDIEKLEVDVSQPKIENIQFPTEESNSAEESAQSSQENFDETQPQGRISYSGSQLWKVCVEDDAKKKVIYRLSKSKDISVWGGNATARDILVKPESLMNVTQKLKENSVHYHISIPDLQKAIDEENPPISEDEAELQNRRGHRLTWSAYHRLDDINGYLDYLVATYPSLCTLRIAGKSVEGRPLRVLKISNGRPGNTAVWVDGGIHAREWISPATVTYIINYLVENFDNQPPEIQNIDWHILPVVNPDGYEFTHIRDRLWRKNRAKGLGCAGIDLNRNFGHEWGGKGASRYPCDETYAGTKAFSEPETAAIRHYITLMEGGAAWRAYVSFHSYGQYVLYPWGYDRVFPRDHRDLQLVGNKAAAAMKAATGAYYRVGSSATLLYPASGGSDDWAKGVVGMKYAYTIESRDTGTYGFVLPAAYINPAGKDGLVALKVIAVAASTE